MGPIEEERSPDEDADALKVCDIEENNKDKTKPSVSKPAENDKKPEIIIFSHCWLTDSIIKPNQFGNKLCIAYCSTKTTHKRSHIWIMIENLP